MEEVNKPNMVIEVPTFGMIPTCNWDVDKLKINPVKTTNSE